jgi:DNA-binding IclR family transcriptional regulator
LRVLAALAEAPDGLSVAELSDGLGLGRTVLYRLVATLEANGYVRRDRKGTCFLGLAVLGLATQVQPTLRRVARPPLRALSNRVGATAHLSIVDGDEVLVLAVVEPTSIQSYLGCRQGSRWPIERGAAGRALAASRAGGAGQEPQVFIAPGHGGFEVASAIPEVTQLAVVVGVLMLVEPDPEEVGSAVRAAARALSSGLRG